MRLKCVGRVSTSSLKIYGHFDSCRVNTRVAVTEIQLLTHLGPFLLQPGDGKVLERGTKSQMIADDVQYP